MSLQKREADRLKSIVERLEKIEEERRGLGEDSKEILEAAKSAGFNTKAIKEVMKLRRQAAGERTAFEEIRTMYAHALGVELDAPLLKMMEG